MHHPILLRSRPLHRHRRRLSPAARMDVTLLVFLILLNGLFAMSEMALTASRKARLQVMVEAGDPGAQAAMDLHENPTKFLSTVQIGITSIGVLNGIVGEAAFSGAAGAVADGVLPMPAEKTGRHLGHRRWWW
jgi:putative hemolysin